MVSMSCPDEKTLSSYLDERLFEAERKAIEAHLSECAHCLDLLVVAYEAQGSRGGVTPPLLKEKVRKRLGLRQKRKRSELKWLFGALVSFTLSFVFKRYFAQFLVAAAILGFKWVIEGEAAKRAIMIFKGIDRDQKKGERKPSSRVSDITGGDRYEGNR